MSPVFGLVIIVMIIDAILTGVTGGIGGLVAVPLWFVTEVVAYHKGTGAAALAAPPALPG